MVSLIFPGQGSQHPGMGRALFEAGGAPAEVFKTADRVLGFSLSGLCFDGPAGKLAMTEYCQPAVFTVSCACGAALGDAAPGFKPAMLAGHSLGELTALCLAGCFSFERGLELVRRRGELMSLAGKKQKGAMCAVIGMEREKLEKVCAEHDLTPANVNCPGQIAVSGSIENIARAREVVKAAGGKAVPLRVSGAFHSPAMREAASEFGKELEKTDLKEARVPVLSNVTAGFHGGPAEIKKQLVRQLYSPVQWHDSVLRMIREGADLFVEAGPGNVLSKLVGRIAPGARAVPANDPETVRQAAGLAVS